MSLDKIDIDPANKIYKGAFLTLKNVKSVEPFHEECYDDKTSSIMKA